jgi:thiosulfate dehydrogenase (quinone) large subunit
MDGKTTGRSLAVLRVFLGWGFLYAGLVKFLQIGATEPFTAAGFLKFGTTGTWPGVAEAAQGAPAVINNPTHDLWIALAGNAGLLTATDTLVVFGQIAIGTALILGFATRFAGIMGALMMLFLTVAAWDFGHGIVNQTSLYMVVALVVAATHAGKVWGLDGVIERTAALRDHTVVQRFAGVVA